MQDHPPPARILEIAIAHLREAVLPALSGRAAFDMRVTLGALGLVQRALMLTPASDAAEQARLQDLLGQHGDLDALNRLLCASIEAGEMNADTPGLREHLRQTAMEKLAVDQPTYSAYRRARDT
ncbi:MAG: DUF6285 domain-containing protein [Hyphomonadaceae bacterium]